MTEFPIIVFVEINMKIMLISGDVRKNARYK